MLKNA